MTDYFYVMTINWVVPGARNQTVHTGTRSGLLTDVPPGYRQEALYRMVYTETCEAFSAPQDTAGVTMYYLAKNL